MTSTQLTRLLIALLFLFAGACAGQTRSTADWRCGSSEPRCSTVFVVYDSWHAAIVLPKTELSSTEIPEVADFAAARYVEFSWGDQDYFPDPDSGVFKALKAAFWSSGSVLHLVGFDDEVRRFYPKAKVIELRLSPAAQSRLTVFVAESFQRSALKQRAMARPGLYEHSRFYPSTQRFSLLNTCNTWVARALETAGLPLTAAGVITASQMGDQLGRSLAAGGTS